MQWNLKSYCILSLVNNCFAFLRVFAPIIYDIHIHEFVQTISFANRNRLLIRNDNVQEQQQQKNPKSGVLVVICIVKCQCTLILY